MYMLKAYIYNYLRHFQKLLTLIMINGCKLLLNKLVNNYIALCSFTDN